MDEEAKRQCFCGACYWCLRHDNDRLQAELEYTRQQLKDAEEARDFWKKESDTLAAENAVLAGKLKEVELCLGWTKPADFANKDQDKRFSEL